MLTPKEKAQELYSHFRYYVYAYGSEKIKEAAILWIDEIIKANPTNWDDGPESQIPFWQQVKEELQKL